MLSFAKVVRVGLFGVLVSFASHDAWAQSAAPTPDQIFALKSQLAALPNASGTGLIAATAAGSGAESQVAITRGVARARSVDLSPEYIESLLAAGDLRVDGNGQLIGTPVAHLFNMFDDANPRVVKLDSTTDGMGYTVWRGTVIGGGEATLVVNGDQITGVVREGARTFRIQPGANGAHRVFEFDEATRPRLENDAIKPTIAPLEMSVPPAASSGAASKAKAAEKPQAVGDPVTVRLLVVYTPDAAATQVDVRAAVALAVAYTNTALANSQTNVTIELAGMGYVDYDEDTRTMENVLEDMRDDVGDFSRIKKLRGNLGADLAMIWIGDNASPELCGLAYLLSDADQGNINLQSFAGSGISVVNADASGSCLTDAFAHELGHNLGSEHDRYVVEDAVPGPDGYNYGYIDRDHFRDIMAYDNQCTEENFDCPLIQYFSNPDVNYEGRPVGIADDQPDAANTSRRIKEIAQVVATFDGGLPAQQALTGAGAVYSSAQSAVGSFLRFQNTNATAGTATVQLRSTTNGSLYGTWTSPSIAAHSEQQFSLEDIENQIASGATKPSEYSVAARANFTGFFQHVLYRPSDGTLTNSSTCSAGVTADRKSLMGVHSTLLQTGFPSTVVLTNTLSAASSARIGVYDARTGEKLGTYTSPAVPANGQLFVSVATIEADIGTTPTSNRYHYVLEVENAFTGFLQHLVNNVQAGVVTDMTTACYLDGYNASGKPATVKTGSIFSTAAISSSQSFLRIYNSSASAGTMAVTVRNAADGQSYGQWTSPSVPAGAELQFFIGDIETDLGIANKPTYYTISASHGVDGLFEHVLYRPADGTLTNLSTCDAGITADRTTLIGVHTATLGSGFPSSVVINNTGTSSATVQLGIYDARDGTKLGTYTSPSVPARSHTTVTVATIENQIGFTPNGQQFHYVIKAEGGFGGFLQHLVNNVQAAVTTDMTTACTLP
ncbi:MAG: hypothetical protein KDE14_01275 [Rhodobacteraceae bacterium]|nr:hypothetical protein [Paracoccaceae bacterium]